MRLILMLLNALLTSLFAFVLAYVWTDENVDDSPYAIAAPVRTWFEGAAAGIVPIVIGTGLCALVLAGTRRAWQWPVGCVVAAGVCGATLGAAARFSEATPAPMMPVVVGLVLIATTGLLADARSHRARPDRPTLAAAG